MDYFINRQAILNNKHESIGYELTFQPANESENKEYLYDDYFTSNIVSGGLLSGILENSNSKKLFIHFTTKLLKNETPKLFTSDRVAIQIFLDDLEEDSKQICMELKKAGYTTVLEDYHIHIDLQQIENIIDIVKIDFNIFSSMELTAELTELHEAGIKLLLFNVESWEDFRESKKFGFDYFQGTFISKPLQVTGHDITGFKVNYLQLLEEISKEEIEFSKIEEIIKRDVALSYNLLRLINSSAFGIRNEITSIKQALALLGRREVKKWCSLVALSDMGKDKPDELIYSSLLRARLCELVALKSNQQKDASELFLLGMFSLITAFIPRPMSEILKGLPISTGIKQALLEGEGPYSKIYRLVLKYENSDFKEILKISQEINLEESELPNLYFDAIEWVNQVLKINN